MLRRCGLFLYLILDPCCCWQRELLVDAQTVFRMAGLILLHKFARHHPQCHHEHQRHLLGSKFWWLEAYIVGQRRVEFGR